jgi:hypothetical protein
MVLTIPYPNVVYRLIEWRRKRAHQSVLNDDDFYESRYTRDALCENVIAVGFEVVEALPGGHSRGRLARGGEAEQRADDEPTEPTHERAPLWSAHPLDRVVDKKSAMPCGRWRRSSMRVAST